MRVFGALLVAFGFLLCLSIVGAIIGLPMILVGVVCLIAGGRRKTVITNVVNVGAPEHRPQSDDWRPAGPDRVSRRNEPKLIEATPVRFNAARVASDPAPVAAFHPKGYDEAKWAAICEYDEDIQRVATALKPYGQKYVDELARAYLTLNDKQYLPMIIQKIVKLAKQDEAMTNAPPETAQRQSGQRF